MDCCVIFGSKDSSLVFGTWKVWYIAGMQWIQRCRMKILLSIIHPKGTGGGIEKAIRKMMDDCWIIDKGTKKESWRKLKLHWSALKNNEWGQLLSDAAADVPRIGMEKLLTYRAGKSWESAGCRPDVRDESVADGWCVFNRYVSWSKILDF